MSFIVGFVCFLLACAFILTLQVRNSRRIKLLENDVNFSKQTIEELNLKLQLYEQKETSKESEGQGEEPGQQAPSSS
jgi:hypothetical protein